MIKIESELSAEEALERIQNNTESPFNYLFSRRVDTSMFDSGWLDTAHIIGWFKANKMCLYKKTYVSNSFKLVFYGEIIPKEKGCEIVGDFKMFLFTRIVLIITPIFTGSVLLFLAIKDIVALIQNEPLLNKDVEGYFALIYLVFFFGSLAILKFRPKQDSSTPEIIEFLNQCTK